MPRLLNFLFPNGLRASTALLLGLLCCLSVAQAQAGRTPRQLIDHLGVDIRKILDDPKATKTPQEAERAVADQISALIARSPGHLSLTELDAQGRTPLMLAAGSGYALIVQALLSDPAVRLAINMPDEDGETAWMVANFAPTVTLVACQPGALTADRYALLPAYVRRMADLLKARPDPIVSIIRDLEAAGAEIQPEQAKRAWLARCHNAAPELREKLSRQDLLPSLIEDALARQREFNKTANEDARRIPMSPPADMKFVLDDKAQRPARREAPLLQIHEMRCDSMAKPDLSGTTIYWSGTIILKAVVATRAGVVETADFTVLKGSKEKRVTDFFRSIIVRALAKYRCDGDHVFEQEFQFDIR
ncbi:hypothetical protein ACS5PN_06175 [Roseateles sp. NT4]|uniref:hypothetical protein n=1 Tax=Roseateles sp. NT4 TaxID=3453715 RepID=UPI003EE97452